MITEAKAVPELERGRLRHSRCHGCYQRRRSLALDVRTLVGLAHGRSTQHRR